MERRDNSFRTLAADATGTTGKSVTIPRTGDTGTTNLTSSSGSSSSLTLSPPNFVSQLHAAIKRPRPLGSMQSKPPRFAARVLVPQGEGASKAGVNPSATQNSEENGMRKQRGALGASRLQNAVPGRNNVDTAVGLLASPLTTPSMLSTITATHNQNAHSSQTKDNFPVTQAAYDQGRKRQELEIAGAAVETDAKYDAANLSQGGIEEACNQNHGDPMTRFSVIGSSATPVSLVCQSNQYTSSMQMPECTVESSAAVPGDIPLKQQGAAMPRTAVVWNPRNQQAPNPVNGAMDKAVSGSGDCLPSQGQGLSANDKSTSAKDDGTSRANMGQKERKKSTYDSEYFFKVNGKRYQKLGKIGSGGSSEVHKVISMDCAIYALKKIKLRGRDYPTAYGFCQEIEYLNKLKGKSNIIQLIDYEVTDKNLLKEGSISPQGGKIKDDQYIFMVLEFGEIDLANMVAQKWKERTNSIMKIDENWLRFYWQQMLEAVNTIHEERIVHSDLKPANFMLVRGSLKLIDFGIAKAIMNDTTNIQRDSQAGTLNYMSPEAFMCNDQDSDGNIIKCGRPSDIWSLGCILYQMVYGKTPFADYKAFWTKYRAITDRNHKINYEPVDNPWLIDLMQKCLAWDRDERWRIPQLLQHPFLVPLVPGDLPRIDRDPCNKLMARVRLHWDNPEVSRLCSELTNVIARLEEDQSNPTSKT